MASWWPPVLPSAWASGSRPSAGWDGTSWRGRSRTTCWRRPSVLEQPQHRALDPLAVDELARVAPRDHPLERAADGLAAVVAVADPRVDVGAAADRRRVRQVTRDAL